MEPANDILNELKGISPLIAGIERKNIFSVPDGYFNTLPDNISKKLDSNFDLFSLPKINALKPPANYFENLSDVILQKIKEDENKNAGEELRELSPILYSIQKKNIFNIPSGYFQNLPQVILEKIKPAAKVVVMKSRNSVWRIAAAAVVTGFIAITSLHISEKSILSEKTNLVIPTNPDPTYPEVKTIDVNEGISKLSDDEIIKYLETTGTTSDNEAINTNIEEKELPSQQDYLTDEKTLDKYLTQIDNKGSQN